MAADSKKRTLDSFFTSASKKARTAVDAIVDCSPQPTSNEEVGHIIARTSGK